VLLPAESLEAYLNRVEQAFQDITVNLMDQRVIKEVRDLQEIAVQNEAIKRELNTVKVNVQGTVNPSTKGGRIGIASWAQLAARGGVIPPSLARSWGSPSMSHGATTWELSQDREVIVKLRDPAIVRKYQEMEPTAIRQAADRVLKAATKECSALQAVQIVASRQLRSGDLSISVRNVNQAELMRRHANQRVRGFGKEAMVRVPTWGAIVGDVPVKSINLSDQKAVISELLAENAFVWDKQAETTHVRWLQYSTNPPANKISTSIVVEFTTPRGSEYCH
jgi:hypothetical protein